MNRSYPPPCLVRTCKNWASSLAGELALRLATTMFAGGIGTTFPCFTAASVWGQPVRSAEVTSQRSVAAGAIQGNQPKSKLALAITGRILDRDGRPVVGVTVRLAQVFLPNDGDLTLWIDAVRCRRFSAANTWLCARRRLRAKNGNP